MKEHIKRQVQLLKMDEGITVYSKDGSQGIHGYYRGYSKSDDIFALRLDDLDDMGRIRVVPIPADLILAIATDEDVKPGNTVEAIFIDVKTQRSIPMTFIRSDDMKQVYIEVKLDGEEIIKNQDALYFRLAATLTENFRSMARRCKIEYE